MKPRPIGVVAALVATALVAHPHGQQPPAPAQARPPVFRDAVALVEIDAVVTGKNGLVVRGLNKDDFEVTEDGKPQPLVHFSFVDIPPPPAATPTAGAAVAETVRPDVSSNAKPIDARLYAIVLDGFHVDPTRSTIVRKLARQFIADSMGPNDMAAVLILGKNGSNQQFTSNKALLSAAVEQFIGQKSRSAILNTLGDANVRMGGNMDMLSAPEDAEAGAKASEARIALESIRQVCEHLGTTVGHRRSVVLFSEGIEVDTTDLIGEDKRPAAGGQGLKYEASKHAADILQSQQDLFEAARRANVALYTVDPRGNTIGDELAMQVTGLPVDKFGRPAMAPPTSEMAKEAQRGQGTLRTFAEQTGGAAVVNTSNFVAGFAQIVQSNSSYYVLGYSPVTVPHDGAFHKIAVTVKSHTVDVVARKGYFAPLDAKPGAKSADAAPAVPPPAPGPNAASPRMREPLASSLPVSGLGLRVTGGPVRSQGNKILVALIVEIDTKDLPFVEQNGLLATDIEMAFLAMDAQGKMQAANRQVGNLRLPPDQRAAVTHGLRYVVEFPVAPGHYQVRVAAHESTGDAGGSALLDVDAPAFDKPAIAMGTVLITLPSAQSVPTTGSFATIKTLLPGPPTALREFTTQDTLAALVNVLGSDVRKGGASLTIIVRTDAGRDVSRTVVPLGTADLVADKSGYSRVVPIPLAPLAPGRYVVTFDASAASGKTASESVAFLVR